MKLLNIAIGLVLFALISCKEDKPSEPLNIGSKRIFVINEGNFQRANASLSVLNKETHATNHDVFKTINNRMLGDVFQSMAKYKDYLYLVVNNSGNIEVINQNDLKSVTTFTNLVSPRYLCFYQDKAFISDLYSNQVSVLQAKTGVLLKTIACKGWTEQMILTHFNEIAVTNPFARALYFINPELEVITDSVNIGYGSVSLVQDRDSILWVSTRALASESLVPRLYQIDSEKKLVLKYFDLPYEASRLTLNNTKDTLYFLMNNALYRHPISKGILDVKVPLFNAAHNLYGLGIDPETGYIYLTDAKDFNQKGEILVLTHEKDGSLKSIAAVKAGFIPSSFYFD